MNQKSIIFWQPKSDFLTILQASLSGRRLLVILNYIIWIFFFYISFLLVRHNSNIFFQLFLATLVSEIIERLLKNKVYWRRPMFTRHQSTPSGLVDSWYKTGSFPSGHTIKSTFFFLFLLQYPVFDPFVFLILVLPLLAFRILVGFHYPVDMLGGLVIGSLVWFFARLVVFPLFMVNTIRDIFNFIFLIN